MSRCIAIFLWISATVLQAQTPEWQAQYDSAQRYWGKQWERAVPFLIKAEKAALYDLGIYDENYLTIVNDLGLAYAKTGDYQNAEKLLTKAITIMTEGSNETDEDLQRTRLNLAAVHADQLHLHEAETLYLKVLNDAQASPSLVVASLKGVVSLYENSDRPQQALALLSDKRFAAHTSTDAWIIVRARIARKSGHYSESMRTLGTLDKLTASNGEHYVLWLDERALNHLEMGNLHAAETELLEALRVLKSGRSADEATLTSVLNDLATVYEKLGLRDKALVYYQEALPLCRKLYGDQSVNTLTLQSNIAGILLNDGHLGEAISNYELIERQLATSVASSNTTYLTVLNNLGTAYRANRELPKARQMFERALALIEKHQMGETDLAATIMNNQAVLLTATGQFKEATPFYEKAYNIRKKIYGDSSVKMADVAGNLAVVYWELGRPDLALPLFTQASSLAIRQVKYVFPNLSEEEQVQFYRRLKEDFERFNAIAFRVASRNPELLTQVFNNELTLKSLRFFTSRHRSDIVKQEQDSVLTRQFEELRTKREQLGYLYQRTLQELSESQISTQQLEQQVDALEKDISLKTRETVAGKMQNNLVTWTDIQKNMSPEDALIEIVRYRKYDLRKLMSDGTTRAMFGFTDSVYYAALISTKETKNHPQLVLMKNGRDMEARNLSYYRNALTYVVTDRLSYNVYWKKLAPYVKNKRRVFLSADGVYHQLNLNTLLDPESNTYLADHHDIHYLLNPGQYVDQPSGSVRGKSAVLIGDPTFDGNSAGASKKRRATRYLPLPGTREEVKEIEALLRAKGWNTTVRLKDQATEASLKSVRGTDILHIATHGFFTIDKINPGKSFKRELTFNSGLLLTGANRSLQNEMTEFHDDGIVTAYEVTNLDLSGSSLVVLSACETGLGNIEIGEGVYGLQRSFLQAGAQNVLISLWKVDDNITKQFMVKFYDHLLQSNHIHEALSKTQQEIRAKHQDPSAWGSFILIGR